MPPSVTITVNSRWRRKQVPPELWSPASPSALSFIAVDKTVSGTLPPWLFLEDFEPAAEHKKKGRMQLVL